MTSFLAASLIIGLDTGRITGQSFTSESPANKAQASAWSRVSPSVAVLPDIAGNPFGLAFLIDSKGYFVAHVSSLVYEPLNATLTDGTRVQLGRIGYDKETQLVLLGAHNWTQTDRPALSLAVSASAGEVMVATAKGPVSGLMTETLRAGVIEPSQRFVPLSEVQMEQKDFPVGGALVIDKNGKLVGILGAVLSPVASRSSRLEAITQSGGQASGGGGAAQKAQNYGPLGLTVGYALGPKVINRVVKGFLSESHHVQHPSVGIFYKVDSTGYRVVIDRVTEGGAAAKAGLLAGDIVLALNGKKVSGPEELAVRLFEFDPGDTVVFRVDRNGKTLEKSVDVGVMASTEHGTWL